MNVKIVAHLLCGFAAVSLHGQGTFQNLNFEIPIPPLVPDFQFRVPITNAMPGWNAYLSGNQVDWVLYNSVTIGAAAVSLQGTGSPNPPIQGNYSAILQPSSGGPPVNAALGQVGQIPSDAKSLLFYGSPSMQVTFAGQAISLITLSTASQYFTLGGDVSLFAGQTGELRFLQPNLQFGVMVYLDNIQFSTEPIPEPRVLGLFTLGALLLGRRILFKRL